MSADIIELRSDEDVPALNEQADGVLESLLKTVEDQARGIATMATFIMEIDGRVRKLELAENKLLRKLVIFDPNGKEIA